MEILRKTSVRSGVSRRRSAVLVAVLVVGAVLFTGGVAQAAAKYSLVTVTWGSWKQYSQQHDNWCWAAGSKMMIQRTKGSSPSECDIVKYIKGGSDCADGSGTNAQVANAIKHWGVSATTGSGIPSFNTIRTMTTTNGGVYTLVMWKSGGSVGHAAPVIGSNTSNQVYITHIRTTAVSGSWITYTQFANGTAGLGGNAYTPNGYVSTHS
jgi:hypothetical protein